MSRMPVERPVARSPVPDTPHPSLQRGFAYNHDFRRMAVAAHDLNMTSSPEFTSLKEMGAFCCVRSIQNWNRRLFQEGHYRPYRRSGNARATVLRGRDAFMLSFFRAVFPKAKIAEVNVFLFGVTGRFFDPAQISRAELRLGFTRKRGSTTARQALFPINVQKRAACDSGEFHPQTTRDRADRPWWWSSS